MIIAGSSAMYNWIMGKEGVEIIMVLTKFKREKKWDKS